MTPLTSALFFAVLITIIVFALATFIASVILILKVPKPQDHTPASTKQQFNTHNHYTQHLTYKKKASVITDREAQFFATLQSICNGYFYIIPQAHLSLFLSEKVVGQDWKQAFMRINGKSVDFLICKRSDHSPVLAIELDDSTHDNSDARQQRDQWVNSTLQNANVPLFRTRQADISPEELRNSLRSLLLPK